jgi:spermidine/putrescine transport system substrate-binding protein
VSRRSLLRASAAAGAAAGTFVAAAPLIARYASAQARTVRVFAWAGYLNDAMLQDFERKTGIHAVYTPYDSNDTAFNQLRASGGRGFDVVQPTVDRVPGYVEYDLLQPIDEHRVNLDKVIPSVVQGSGGMGGVVQNRRYLAPTDWGTEALAFHMQTAPLTYGQASYGDMWRPEMRGKVAVRGHSGLVGIGLMLEAQGRLPRPMRESFANEQAMRANYDVIVGFAIENKRSVGQFWTNENQAQGAFRTNGCVIGQTWDSSAAALWHEGLPIRYIAPKEGALAWLEGYAIPKGAENVEQAYAFINWFLTPEVGAMYTDLTSINSTVVGAEQRISDFNKQFFAAAYPGDALQKLWWWPIQEPWFVSARNEYQDRWLAAS